MTTILILNAIAAAAAAAGLGVWSRRSRRDPRRREPEVELLPVTRREGDPRR